MAQALTYGARNRAFDAGHGLFARLGKTIADYRLFRATRDELERLTDRELADLGLHRANIADVARESVYGA